MVKKAGRGVVVFLLSFALISVSVTAVPCTVDKIVSDLLKNPEFKDIPEATLRTVVAQKLLADSNNVHVSPAEIASVDYINKNKGDLSKFDWSKVLAGSDMENALTINGVKPMYLDHTPSKAEINDLYKNTNGKDVMIIVNEVRDNGNFDFDHKMTGYKLSDLANNGPNLFQLDRTISSDSIHWSSIRVNDLDLRNSQFGSKLYDASMKAYQDSIKSFYESNGQTPLNPAVDGSFSNVITLNNLAKLDPKTTLDKSSYSDYQVMFKDDPAGFSKLQNGQMTATEFVKKVNDFTAEHLRNNGFKEAIYKVVDGKNGYEYDGTFYDLKSWNAQKETIGSTEKFFDRKDIAEFTQLPFSGADALKSRAGFSDIPVEKRPIKVSVSATGRLNLKNNALFKPFESSKVAYSTAEPASTAVASGPFVPKYVDMVVQKFEGAMTKIFGTKGPIIEKPAAIQSVPAEITNTLDKANAEFGIKTPMIEPPAKPELASSTGILAPKGEGVSAESLSQTKQQAVDHIDRQLSDIADALQHTNVQKQIEILLADKAQLEKNRAEITAPVETQTPKISSLGEVAEQPIAPKSAADLTGLASKLSPEAQNTLDSNIAC